MGEKKETFKIIVYDNNTGEIIYNGVSIPATKIDFHWDYSDDVPDLPECKVEFSPSIVIKQ